MNSSFRGSVDCKCILMFLMTAGLVLGSQTDSLYAQEVTVDSDPWPAPAGTPVKWTLTFRGRPLPHTRWFIVTETSARSRISGNLESKNVMSSDVGLMRNLSDRWALGGTLFLEVDEDSGRWGLRPRARYWLSEDVSLDISPGLILGEEGGSGSGFVASASLGLAEFLALTVQYESLSRDEFVWNDNASEVDFRKVTYSGLQVGATAQAYTGLVIGVVTAVSLAMAVSVSGVSFSL